MKWVSSSLILIKDKSTALQVHPDGGHPGSLGYNCAQDLDEASAIYRALRWRAVIPYCIQLHT